MTTSQKIYVLEVNATGMNTVKNQQNYFGVRKTIRSSKNTIKNLLLMIRKLQTKYIFHNIQGNFVELFLKNANKKPWQKLKVFSVISIFQNSMKINQIL